MNNFPHDTNETNLKRQIRIREGRIQSTDLKYRSFTPLDHMGGGRSQIPENSRLIQTFYCGCPHEKKKFQQFSFIPAQSTFGTPSKKILNFFASILKNLLTNPS